MAEASNGPRARPMSPHLTVWRWHITMAGSILHRVTGVGLYLGALIAAWWAFSLASGPDAYAAFKACMASPLGLFVMFGMTVSFFYHLAAGVRHTIWDLGHGLTLKAANAITVATFAFAVAATLAVWFIASQTGAL